MTPDSGEEGVLQVASIVEALSRVNVEVIYNSFDESSAYGELNRRLYLLAQAAHSSYMKMDENYSKAGFAAAFRGFVNYAMLLASLMEENLSRANLFKFMGFDDEPN